MIKEISSLNEMARQLRRDIIRMVSCANSGHPGGSLGCADLLTALYFSVLKQTPDTWRPDGQCHDMFFLSIGHISPALYSVLARAGYIDMSLLNTFRYWGSPLQGHPSPEWNVRGIHVATGSLGQGLSVACGAALAKKMNGDPHLVYALIGDGETEEGQIWEAAMFAAARKIDNLVAITDCNGQQIDGAVKDVLDLGNLQAKWNDFGWNVMTMDGHDILDIKNKLNIAHSHVGTGKPTMLLMNTQMGYGVDFMQGTHHWHGKAPNAEQTAKALSQLPETCYGDY